MKSNNPPNLPTSPPQARILVVDDEPDQLALLQERLSSRGYEVFTAETGLAALNQARRHLPDLILLDIMLGDMDGFSVCEILRSQPSTARTPVIIMTAIPGEITRLNSFASGAVDFVSKPVRFRNLLARMEAMLARQHPPNHPLGSCATPFGYDFGDAEADTRDSAPAH